MYTTGMSDMPMTLPEEIADREDLKHAELFMFLPGVESGRNRTAGFRHTGQ